MQIKAKPLPFMLAIAAQTSARSLLRFTPAGMNPTPASRPRPAENLFFKQTGPVPPNPAACSPMSIYAVDDTPRLTELYASLLEGTGYRVKTFNDRADALAALRADDPKPDLLITDYLGLSMPADQFMHACRMLHPSLRILMVSGINQTEMRLFRAQPDRFIEKPFTPDELLQHVKAILAVA